MERTFVEHMIQTDDGVYSATKAGYANPAIAAWKLQQRPAIRKDILDGQQIVIDTEILPLAVARHKQLLTSEKTGEGALVKAIDLAYKRSLGVALDTADTKELHEMTADELAHLIVLAKARTIDVEPAEPNVFD